MAEDEADKAVQAGTGRQPAYYLHRSVETKYFTACVALMEKH